MLPEDKVLLAFFNESAQLERQWAKGCPQKPIHLCVRKGPFAPEHGQLSDGPLRIWCIGGSVY